MLISARPLKCASFDIEQGPVVAWHALVFLPAQTISSLLKSTIDSTGAHSTTVSSNSEETAQRWHQ